MSKITAEDAPHAVPAAVEASAPAKATARFLRRFIPSPNVDGFIDRLHAGDLVGWVRDPKQPESRLHLELYDDKTLVYSFVADQLRKDLAAAGLGDGRYGFRCPIPASLKDGKLHTLQLRLAGKSAALLSEALPFTQEPTSPLDSPKAASAAATPPVEPTRTAAKSEAVEKNARQPAKDPTFRRLNPSPNVDGFVDRIHQGALVGWVRDPKKPENRVRLALYEDETLVCSFIADQLRRDLAAAGLGDGQYGFNCPLPQHLKDGKPHSLQLRIAGMPEPLLSETLVFVQEPIKPVDPPKAAEPKSADRKAPESKIDTPVSPAAPDLAAPEKTEAAATQKQPKARASTFRRLRPSPNLDGFVDKIYEGAVVGWVRNPRKPENRINLALYDDETLLCSFIADRLREDLANAGLHDGRYGFSCPIPGHLRDGKPHNLQLRIAGTTELLLSPALPFLEQPIKWASPPGSSVSIPAPKGAILGCSPGNRTSPYRLDDLGATATHDLVTFSESKLGLIHKQDSTKVELDQTSRVISLLGAFAKLHSLDPKESVCTISADAAKVQRTRRPASLDAIEATSLSENLPSGIKIADVWFATDTTLRIRIDNAHPEPSAGPLVFRAYQVDQKSSRLRLCAEQGLLDNAISFVDVRLFNPYLPLLIAASQNDGLIRGTVMMPFPALCRGGAYCGELYALANGLAYPESLVALSESLLLEFFSTKTSRAKYLVDVVEVDITNATGAEKIFSPLLNEWLTATMGLTLSARSEHRDGPDSEAQLFLAQELQAPASAQTPSTPFRQGKSRLCLPAHALPTISAIVAGRKGGTVPTAERVGSYVVANQVTQLPTGIVHMPPMGEMLLSLQPITLAAEYPMIYPETRSRAGVERENNGFPFPLAINYRGLADHSMATALFPVAPDTQTLSLLRRELPDAGASQASVTAIINIGEEPRHLETSLLALSVQSAKKITEVIAILKPSAQLRVEDVKKLLDEFFPGSSFVLLGEATEPRLLNLAAAMAKGDYLFFLTDATLLHDDRTLAVLCTLAAEKSVATASCTLLGEFGGKEAVKSPHFSGYFPAEPSSTQPFTKLQGLQVAGPLGRMTIPVVANKLSASVVSASVWKTLGGVSESATKVDYFEIDFCIRAIDAGYIHLNTGIVSATAVRLEKKSAAAESVLPAAATESFNWQSITSNAVCYQELQA